MPPSPSYWTLQPSRLNSYHYTHTSSATSIIMATIDITVQWLSVGCVIIGIFDYFVRVVRVRENYGKSTWYIDSEGNFYQWPSQFTARINGYVLPCLEDARQRPGRCFAILPGHEIDVKMNSIWRYRSSIELYTPDQGSIRMAYKFQLESKTPF